MQLALPLVRHLSRWTQTGDGDPTAYAWLCGYAMLTLCSSIALTDTQDFVGVEAAAGPEGIWANSMNPGVKMNMGEKIWNM